MSKSRRNMIVELADPEATRACFLRLVDAMTGPNVPPIDLGDGLFAIAKLASATLMQTPASHRAKFVGNFNDLYLSFIADELKKEKANAK